MTAACGWFGGAGWALAAASWAAKVHMLEGGAWSLLFTLIALVGIVAYVVMGILEVKSCSKG